MSLESWSDEGTVWNSVPLSFILTYSFEELEKEMSNWLYFAMISSIPNSIVFCWNSHSRNHLDAMMWARAAERESLYCERREPTSDILMRGNYMQTVSRQVTGIRRRARS